MKQKGFTLIELLVVVAIIGILATVVLASLGQARTRARDAAIKSAISQARADLEIQFLDFDTYVSSGTTCLGHVGEFDASIRANGGSTTAAGTTEGSICNASTNAYAFYTYLNENTKYFCADSTGFSGEFVVADDPIATPTATSCAGLLL